MSTWNIYHKDGSKLTDVNGEQITVHGLEYSDSWMGECFVTINFKHEVPINFQIGDYIVYRGERFELNYEPGKDKQARPDTYGEGFVYDSVKFNALQDELARAEFLDVVLNDNELHYTSLPKFPFYVQTLDDLLDRIQACLNEQIGAGLWKIYSRNKERSVQRGALESEWLSVYGEKTDDNVIESMSITVDSQTCWQALALVNEKWDINFIVRGRNIYVGTTGIQANHIFKYGLGNGLYEIVQNADSDQSVVTRLRAYGSEKNLPSHYYADLGVKYVANITKVVGASTNVTLELDLDYIETYFKNPRKYIVPGETGEQSLGWVLKVTFDFKTEITGYVTQAYDSKKCRFYSELKGTQTDTGDEESKEKLDAFIAQVKAGNTKMYITSGLNKKAVPSSMKEYAKNLPNNMSINRLMLPGFPHVSLSDFYNTLTDEEKKYVNPTGRQHKFSTDPHRPYIDSINIEQIGLRSASQFFETDDKTNGVIEIYPTIEEMEIGGVRVDEIDEGVAPDDDGRFGDNETVKNVDIYLKKAIDFDINDLKDDDFSISMKDGMCGGRTFKVASSTKIDGRWRLTIERVKDDALELWFPYKDYPIKKGDHFVLTDITLPDSYVNAASLKLLKYAIAFIDKNDYTRYVYQPKVDEIFMARQHDLAEKDTTGVIKSLHDTLKAGDLMEFEDTDLRIGGVISIDQLTIKEEDGKIPTYDITLREDKEVGTIQKIQQQISSLQSGNGGTGAGLTTTQVKSQVATEGSKHFISKINDDTAKGTITWEKVQKFLQGLLVGGGSWTPDAEGRSHLITDYLEVRMKAIFEELVINKTSTIGGKEIISPAGGVVAHKVEEVTVTYNNVSQKAYRCYFLAEQEGDAVDNDFAVGDQVRSESFNVRKGTYHKAGNHFYWRLVIGRDEDPVELEGKKYHYIDLSDTDCATASDVPAKGDVLNQCGNRTDVERQNCLIFSAVDTYSPSISLYHGINSYSFANREYVEYGVNKKNNKAFFNVYGDMYFGDRPTSANNYEGDSYVKYDSDKKKVTIKGDLDIKSTYDGKTLDKYIADKSLDKDAVETIIKKSQTIIDLQLQIDGAIETWFFDGIPTLKNAPAIGWTTDDDKKTHLGDLYYDNKTGKAYRFAKDGSTYKWIIITDTELTKALEDSRQALKDAKSKRRIFGSQPVPPYDVNDMWVNATYPNDGSTYKNEILKCSTAKAEGEKFDIADWKLASKYTDDTKAEEAKKAAEKAQEEIKTTQSNLNTLGTTVSNNKKAFDDFTSDGYLDSSEIAAIAQDSKRLEDDYNAAVESYNNVVGSKFLLDKDGNETTYKTDLVSAKATLDSAKNELITYLSDIVSRYNASDSNGKATIKAAAAQKYTNFTNAYKAFYDKLGVANNYISSNLFDGLNTKLITNMAGLEYIKAALVDGDTVVKGGLILSTLIALRNDKGNVTAGINGTDTKENGIALWLGGKAIDRQASTTKEDEMDSAAKALLRFDGTGYFANGNLWWDADGILHADPTSFIINKNNVGVQLALFAPIWKSGTTDTTKLANVLSIDPQKPFTHLDVSGNITTEGSLRIGGIYLSWDSENNALRLSKDAAGKEAANFYALGGITAYGKGAGTSGGGGLIASVISYARIIEGNYTDADLTSIPNAYAIKALSSRIDNIASELGGLSLSWNNITGKPSTFTPSAHTHKWTEITDRITKVSQLTNDKGYLTAHQSLASYYTKAEIDAKGYTTNKGTVTSVALTLPTGLTCATKVITTSGTFAISLASGYSIPTTAKQTAWDGAVSAKHTHSNKSVLDGITSTKVTCWDSAYDWYALITTDEETADGVINKWNEVVSFLANIAQTDTLSGIVDGINKSISDEVTRAKKAEGVNASGISTNKTSITTLQGYFTSGSAKKALQLTNTRKLWGNSFNGTADINGSIIVPDGKYISIGNIKMEYDATNKALKITNTTTNEVANLYTSGGVSAYGVGTSSSSGGGLNGSVKSYSNALKLTSESLSEIASAYSIKALDSRISSLEGGSAMDVSVSGSGNAVTAISKSGTTIIVTKGTTFLTSHQSLASYLTKADAASLYQPKGNYLTAHQSLDGYVNAIAVSGSGNAVTAVTKSGKTITFTKGATYLTSHQSLSNYYTKSSVDSLLNGKSATTHTHSVKINGITKTIAASGGDAVDLGTYLTAHQSLAAYATQNWVKNEATAHNADMVDNYHASGLFTGFSISDVANKVTISIGGTSKALNLVRAFPSGVGNNFNDIATHGNSMGMSNIAAPYASSTANYQTLNGYVNPNGQTGWHHYINLSYTDSNNTATSPNMWQTQFAIKAGTTEVYVRSRAGGKISNDAAWAAPWVRLARVTDNVASASKVANALSWSGYSSGSYNGSAVKSISIPNNTNQLTNGAGFITSSASITGNAGSATKLQNARTINGTSFNGTANIVTSYWGTTRKLWGNSVNGNADVNGSITIANTDGVYVQIGDVRLVYDKANTAIKVVKSDGTTAANFYATGGISAYGEGSAGTTGSNNFSAKAYADSIKLTSENLSEIASAYSIAVLNNSLNAAIGRISTLEGGSATSIETTGSGNAVTSVSKSGTKITFTKGSTFSYNGHTHTFASLTSKPTSLSGYGITDGVNAVSATGSGNAVTAASVSGHTLTLTKGSSFSLSNHTHYIGTTQVQGSSAEQALTGITKIDNILKLSKASVTVNTSYKAEQNRLVIYGSTYGNDANYIKSAGKLSYGDGGPQLVFSTSENPDASGVQSAALVYTDHDTIGAGVSLSFVTNQGDAYFIAPHIKALTAFQGNLAWSYITNKPTTLSGFGITDGLRSVTQPSGSNVFVTGISTSGTAITYTKSYTKKSLSAVGTSGWTNASIDGNIIPDMSFIAYWNGAYSGTSSNLAYCNKGAFGSFAIKNSLAFSELTSKPTTISGYGITDAYTKSQVDTIAAKYLPLTGGTLTGQLKIEASALNGAYNGLRIGDDCYIGDCNFGNTIGLMGVGNNNAGMVKFGKGGMQFGYNGSNHIASTTAQWTNLNADLLDGWHKNNIVWSGAVNSNTASLSHYWAKLFDITVTGNQYDDRNFTFLFSNGFNDTFSVVVLRIRQNGAKDSGAYNFIISLRELVGNMSSRLRVYYNNATGNVQLWGNCQRQYGSLSYTIIKKTGRTSADFTSQGTLVTNTSFSAAQSLPATTGDSPYTLLDGATRIGIVNQADQLVTARTIWGQSFNGTANVSGALSGATTISASNTISTTLQNGALKIGNKLTPISAIDEQVIFNTGAAIRFGETAWDLNQWAGLKYNHSNKTIYLGIADKSVFTANSAQSNGTLKFPGITTITPDSGARIGGSGGDLYLGNANNSNWVKVQDICSHNGSNYWYIYQNGNAHFNNIVSTGATINGDATINGTATIGGNLSVTGLISNKGILPANYEFNNKGADCYVSADALCSGITAITDSIQINQVAVQYSNDSGNSWTNYPMSNDAKFNLYASNAGLTQVYLGYDVITGNNDAEKLAQVKKNELIVSFYISNSCYAQPYFASVDISNGIDTICTVDILNNSGAIVETYTKHMTGWNQINYISLLHNGNVGYGVGNNDRRYIRFRFKHDQKTTALRNTVVNQIRIFSFTKYSFPTDRFMGHTGHIYNFDYNMNTYFPNSILAKGGVTAYQSSDIRLKQDLRKLDYLGIIKAMGGTYGFAWKNDNTRSIGWIAQHVLCNPHLKDIVETDEKGYYKINYWSPKLIATAFGAIEQVGDEVSRLKARVVFLESEVLRLSGDKEDCNKKRLDNKNINSLN